MRNASLKYPTRIAELLLLGLIITGCETSPETPWREMMTDQAVMHQFEENYPGFTLTYEKGAVGYLVMLNGSMTKEDIRMLREERKLSSPKLIRDTFQLTLNGVPLDEYTKGFPDYQTEQFGNIMGDPLPDKLLEFNPYLRDQYAKAQKGDPEDIYLLGKAIYKNTNRVHPDLKPLGFYWIKKAADAGHPAACSDVASCYMDGSGVQKNQEAYRAWARKAAELGDPWGLNQAAWTVATTRVATREELLEARDFARKAIEIEFDSSVADTLATLEALLGNWEDAITIQSNLIDSYHKRYGYGENFNLPYNKREKYNLYKERLKQFQDRKIPETLFL